MVVQLAPGEKNSKPPEKNKAKKDWERGSSVRPEFKLQ
jgi:hypothetical protein